MEAKFGQTKDGISFFKAVHVAAILFGIFAICCSENKLVGLVIYLAVYTPIDVLFMNYKGKIIADESGITVIRTIFGRKISKKFIDYSEIQSTDCGVDTVWNRLMTTRCVMKFTLKMKDDNSEIAFLSTMNISVSFPAEQPDMYKQYLHEQPLMQLSHYIDSKLHLNASA